MTLAPSPASTAGLLTYADVAGRLGISPRTVRREVDARRLRTVRIRSRVLFEPAEVEAYIRRQRSCQSENAAASGTSISPLEADRALGRLLDEVLPGRKRSRSRRSSAGTITPATSAGRRV